MIRNKTKTLIHTEEPLSRSWLRSKNFRFNKYFSDVESIVYTYRFPVFKYGKYTTLECELRSAVEKDVIYIDVYHYNTHDKYAPFYDCEYGNFDKILTIIDKKIMKQLKELGIKERNAKPCLKEGLQKIS